MGTFLVGMGFVLGIDPIVSQAHGARDAPRAGLALQQGLVIALLAAIPVGISWIWTTEVLVALGQDAELARVAEEYALVQLPGLPCLLCFVALRHWLQGRSIVRPTLWIALLGNLVNILANWALIFGRLGCPALGVVGAGISTGLTQVAMVAALVWLVVWGRLGRGGWAGWTRAAWAPLGLLRVIAIGAPIAITIGLEMWAFQLATLWSGRIDATALAAHTITINLASLTFMPALGISIGAATRVGNLIGARDPHGAQRSAWLSLALSAAWMALCALGFLLGRRLLPALYTQDQAVIALASSVMPIASKNIASIPKGTRIRRVHSCFIERQKRSKIAMLPFLPTAPKRGLTPWRLHHAPYVSDGPSPCQNCEPLSLMMWRGAQPARSTALSSNSAISTAVGFVRKTRKSMGLLEK
jgi:MATE family multidrug resistance protein